MNFVKFDQNIQNTITAKTFSSFLNKLEASKNKLEEF